MGPMQAALRAKKQHKLQEELDCERLSREVFMADDADQKLQSLFGEEDLSENSWSFPVETLGLGE